MSFNKLKEPDLQRFSRRFGKYYGHLIDRDFLLGRDPREDSWIAPENNLPTNNKEKKDSCELEIPLPGWNKDDIKISLKRNILSVKGILEEDLKDNDSEYVIKEHYVDCFERLYTLSPHVDKSQIEAKLSNGMLRIHLYYTAKSKKFTPGEIRIE